MVEGNRAVELRIEIEIGVDGRPYAENHESNITCENDSYWKETKKSCRKCSKCDPWPVA